MATNGPVAGTGSWRNGDLANQPNLELTTSQRVRRAAEDAHTDGGEQQLPGAISDGSSSDTTAAAHQRNHSSQRNSGGAGTAAAPTVVVHGLGNSRLHAPQPHRPLGSVSPASSGNDGSGAVYTAKELHALALAAVPNRVDSPAIDEDDEDIEAGRKEVAGATAAVASIRGATNAAASAAARSDGERDLASPSGHPPVHHPKSPSSNGWTGNQQQEMGLASQSGISTNGHGGSGGLLSSPQAVPAHAHSGPEPPSPSPVQQKLVLSEFAREMEARFGRPQHGFSRLKIRRDPFFSRPTLSHFLHRPQLKQYYRGVHTAGQLVLVRESQERRARWNELFFDLVFIVVFQRIGHQLHGADHLDGRALCEFAVMFGAAWKTWIDLTLYVNQFDPTDTLHKVYFMLQMIFVMGLAVMSIKGVIGSYLMGTGLTLALRCWSAKYSPRAVQDAKAQVFVYFLGAAPWLASMAYPAPEDEDGQPIGRADLAHFQLWGVGLIIHYLGLFAFQCTARFHVPLNIEHITERMGIFTILCLGEMVLALLFTDVHGTSDSFLMAALGGALIFAVQILYYDVDGFNHKMHALRGERWRGFLWVLLHCPLQALIILSSVTFDFFVSSTLSFTPHSGGLLDADHVVPGQRVYATDAREYMLQQIEVVEHHGEQHAFHIYTVHQQLFCSANGGIMLVIFLIACLHRARDGHLIRRSFRLAVRGLGTLVMFGLQFLGERISPMAIMAFAGCWMMFVAALDIYGSHVPRKPKHVPAAAAVSPATDTGTGKAAHAAVAQHADPACETGSPEPSHFDDHHDHDDGPADPPSVMSKVW